MKRFLKTSGGVDQYPEVKVEWIRGHNPELYVYDGDAAEGKASRKIDLSTYKYDDLHRLFEQELGFQRKSAEAPQNMLRGSEAKEGTTASRAPASKLNDAVISKVMAEKLDARAVEKPDAEEEVVESSSSLVEVAVILLVLIIGAIIAIRLTMAKRKEDMQ